MQDKTSIALKAVTAYVYDNDYDNDNFTGVQTGQLPIFPGMKNYK